MSRSPELLDLYTIPLSPPARAAPLGIVCPSCVWSRRYVDLALFYILFELAEDDAVPDFASRFNLPALGAFLGAMSARPRLDAYVRSARRMPRYLRPGYNYCAGRFSPAPPTALGRLGTDLSEGFLAREQRAPSES